MRTKTQSGSQGDRNVLAGDSDGGQHSRWIALATWLLAMVVLASTVAGGMLHLRSHTREHLAERDGDILATVALARQYANGTGSNLTQRLRNPADQLALALEISQIREGVLGVRLFDADGHFETAFPPTLIETNLEAGEVSILKALKPSSRFFEHARLADYFLVLDDAKTEERVPVLQVVVPLYPRGSTNLVASAQLLLDARGLSQEYARVDGHLWLMGVALYAGGALLLTLVLLWAYWRISRTQRLLRERTKHLLRANHELALAAKTNALGSVTAHLIHGLSNPLANLSDFIASRGSGADDEELKALAQSTRRMQQLVHEVVRVLGEEHGGEHYQLSLRELVAVLNGKLTSMVQESGVSLFTELSAEGELSNRHANLILLILENLIHNAIKVTPKGAKVGLYFLDRGSMVSCEVEDQGPGIAPGVLERLFTPCRSTQGGSGLGLAISKQLAAHLGADLILKSSSAAGCVFALMLPRTLFAAPHADPKSGERLI